MTCWVGLAIVLIAGCGREEDECDATKTVISQGSGPDQVSFHNLPSNAKIAQGFKSSGTFNLATVSFSIMKVGSPAGDISLSIHQDDGGKPDSRISGGGPVLVNIGEINDAFFKEITVKFPDEPKLAGETLYHLVIDFSGGVGSAHYFELEGDTSGNPYSDGTLSRFDSESEGWTPSTNEDLEFRIEACEDDG